MSAPGLRTHSRVVGVTALALATSWIVQNLVVAVVVPGAPTYADPISEVAAFHASHRGSIALLVGLEALNLPLLLGFLTGLRSLVGARGGAGASWLRLALAAASTYSAVMAVYAVAWVATVLASEAPTVSLPAVEVAWRLHSAAFAFGLPALGTTVVGAALAAQASGLTARWQRNLAVAGGALLLAAGTVSPAVADGSPLLFVGMVGYAAWLVWLVATGARLVGTRALLGGGGPQS